MSYSVSPCTDVELLAQGLEFEVCNDTPRSGTNLNECVALCYTQTQANAISAALNRTL